MKNKKTPGAGKAPKSAPGAKPGTPRKSAKLPPWMPESLATPAQGGRGKSRDSAPPKSFVRGRSRPAPAAAPGRGNTALTGYLASRLFRRF